MTAKTVLAGQIWREKDPRFERLVKVVHVTERHAIIRTVIENNSGADGPGRYSWAPRSREIAASLDRFNGKSKGYSLWRDV